MVKLFLVFVVSISAMAAIPKLSNKKTRCEHLGDSFKTKLSVPFESFYDKAVSQCVEKSFPSRQTLALFVASAFYFESLDVRKQALGKLEEYNCTDKIDCGQLYEYLDAHIKATVLAQPKSWKDFRSRTTTLRDRVFARAMELRNAR
jgi:hypothetical protein